MTIRKDSPLPLYHQVAQELRRRIRTGDLRPGQRLANERELSESYGVSRMTLRQAVARLVQEGWLVVRHGRGTFVADPKLTYDAVNLMGFTETMLRQDGAVTSDVLQQEVHGAPNRVADALGLQPNEQVVSVVRLRYVDGVAVALESSTLPHRTCAGLEQVDLEHGSLYDVLRTRYGIALSHAEQSISATTAGRYEAGLFDVGEGASLLLVDGVTFTDDDEPAEYFEVLYRADRFKLAVRSERPTGDRHDARPDLQMVVARHRPRRPHAAAHPNQESE